MMAVVAAIEPFWNSLIYKIFFKKKTHCMVRIVGTVFG